MDIDKSEAKELAKQADEEVLRFIIESPAGRKFVRRILDYTGPLRLSYVPGGHPQDTYFQEGKRDVGNYIISQLNRVDKRAFIRILEEKEYAG